MNNFGFVEKSSEAQLNERLVFTEGRGESCQPIKYYSNLIHKQNYFKREF